MDPKTMQDFEAYLVAERERFARWERRMRRIALWCFVPYGTGALFCGIVISKLLERDPMLSLLLVLGFVLIVGLQWVQPWLYRRSLYNPVDKDTGGEGGS